MQGEGLHPLIRFAAGDPLTEHSGTCEKLGRHFMAGTGTATLSPFAVFMFEQAATAPLAGVELPSRTALNMSVNGPQ